MFKIEKVGRLIFCIYFMTIGWEAFKNRREQSHQFSEQYKSNHAHREAHFNIKHPEFLHPEKVNKNRLGLLSIGSLSYMGLGGFTAVGSSCAPLALALVTLAKIELYHAPWKHTTLKEFVEG